MLNSLIHLFLNIRYSSVLRLLVLVSALLLGGDAVRRLRSLPTPFWNLLFHVHTANKCVLEEVVRVIVIYADMALDTFIVPHRDGEIANQNFYRSVYDTHDSLPFVLFP